MRNILITLEYDGTNYHGWQRQKNALSIQEVLEECIFKITGEKVNVIGSGRTDAGVHALGQRANFVTKSSVPTERFPYALNSVLPPDIRVVGASEVPSHFHARCSAVKKRYRYRIFNSPFPAAIYRNYCYYTPERLDIEAMREATKYLLGEKDFTSFSSTGSNVKSKVRRVMLLEIVERDNTFSPGVGVGTKTAVRKGKVIDIIIEADGFLYNMVRIISGTLLEVGKGKLQPGDVADILEGRDRKLAGPTLPPHGLFLEAVYYNL